MFHFGDQKIDINLTIIRIDNGSFQSYFLFSSVSIRNHRIKTLPRCQSIETIFQILDFHIISLIEQKSKKKEKQWEISPGSMSQRRSSYSQKEKFVSLQSIINLRERGFDIIKLIYPLIMCFSILWWSTSVWSFYMTIRFIICILCAWCTYSIGRTSYAIQPNGWMDASKG